MPLSFLLFKASTPTRTSPPIKYLFTGLAIFLCAQNMLAHAAEGGGHHPHHVAAATGAAWHDDKSSAYLGLDYVYNFESGFTAGVFYEEVSGDFDLQAWGALFGRTFSNGFKFSAGPGAEYKLKKKETLLLFRTTAGYDWHFGSWSVGPAIAYDFIEDESNTLYVGVAVGYGF